MKKFTERFLLFDMLYKKAELEYLDQPGSRTKIGALLSILSIILLISLSGYFLT
jgi:hypothetical protein